MGLRIVFLVMVNIGWQWLVLDRSYLVQCSYHICVLPGNIFVLLFFYFLFFFNLGLLSTIMIFPVCVSSYRKNKKKRCF